MNEKKLSLYIFGTGAMASIIIPSLQLSKCDIISFADERPHTWNTEYMSRPVISLKDIHINQCDFLLIICRDAKNIAHRLSNDYAIPRNKIITIDVYDKLYKNTQKESILRTPTEVLKEYLCDFPEFFEIIDMEKLSSIIEGELSKCSQNDYWDNSLWRILGKYPIYANKCSKHIIQEFDKIEDIIHYNIMTCDEIIKQCSNDGKFKKIDKNTYVIDNKKYIFKNNTIIIK